MAQRPEAQELKIRSQAALYRALTNLVAAATLIGIVAGVDALVRW